MILRKAKLESLSTTEGGLFSVEVEDVAPLLCWRDTKDEKPCTSDCAAWRIEDNVLKCMALPSDKRVVAIIT